MGYDYAMAKPGKFAERLDAIISLFERGIQWMPVLVTSGVGGGFAWAASVTSWANEYGPLVWWAIGLCAAAVTMLIYWLWSAARLYSTNRNFMKSRDLSPESVNPLDMTFDRKRIDFADLADPITKVIHGKTFVDCELLGSGLSFLYSGSTFDPPTQSLNCDMVALPVDVGFYPRPNNSYLITRCIFRRCKFYEQTMIFNRPSAQMMYASGEGLNWLIPPDQVGKEEEDGNRKAPKSGEGQKE